MRRFTRDEWLTAWRTDTGTSKLAGHEPQAKALDSIAQQARTPKLLDPTSKTHAGELSGRWKITVNWPR